MEVIKKGTPTTLPITKTCDCCNSVLRFFESDGRIEMKWGSKLLHVNCPECGHEITVTLSKPPVQSPYSLQVPA
jgi:hypothetical protein